MLNLHRAIELIESEWDGARALVVGDVMLDKYVWGEVERISPEAPVPVLLAHGDRCTAGGAANVAMNLSGLGARATLIGFVGDDEDRDKLVELLDASGIEHHLVTVPEMPTVSKLRILSGSQQMLRLDREHTLPQARQYSQQVITNAVRALDACSVVILSDYAKGVLSDAVCQAVIEAARSRGIPVLVDPKGKSFEKYRGATTICPNKKELMAVASGHHELDDLLQASTELVKALDLDYLTVTLSERGIATIDRESYEIAPAVAKQVFDVSGAGDTVIAILALAASAALDRATSIALANSAAGIVVSKAGTVPVARHELIAAVSGEIAINKEEKVLNLHRLLTRVAEWRDGGDRIVFTNGCFDLLHVGHVTLLEHARRLGDKLIVAINSDASVQQLKGPSRPVVSESERAQVMAALGAVDAVVVFDEATPLKLIEAVRPDVLVKGGDYVQTEVVGYREVTSHGGRVVIVPTVPGFSTTKLIDRSQADGAKVGN